MKRQRFGTACKLFAIMLYISAFTFGGGFVIVTLMKSLLVDHYGLISEEEMLDITAMAQSSPGAIAVNAAILVGWRAAGFWGMVLSVLGTIIPPLVILTTVSLLYERFITNEMVALILEGMQAGVAAVILNVAFTLAQNIHRGGNRVHMIIAVTAFVAAFVLDISIIPVLLSACAVGMILAVVRRRKEARG